MSVIANRRSIMNLFSKPTCIHSHRTRIVLAEKNINIDITSVVGPDLPEDLMDINPYHTLPTLIDRDLVLYDSRVIIEYLDERFPHPPLMPVDPVTRAQFRMALYRIEQDWYTLADKYAVNGEGKLATKPKKMLKESILAAVDLFSIKDYFISDDFSLVDCTIAPILWRLPEYGIDLGQNAAAIDNYMDRIRAMLDWINDNKLTPYILVDTNISNVTVPEKFINKEKIILNIGHTATDDLNVTLESISFNGRFDGKSLSIFVPTEAILSIYTKETGDGMIFSDEGTSQPKDKIEKKAPHLKLVE